LNVQTERQECFIFAAFDPGGIANYLDDFCSHLSAMQPCAVLVYTVEPRGNGVLFKALYS
jgi:hypothetical protein